MSSNRIGKYFCLEIERRYLLAEHPADLPQNAGWHIQVISGDPIFRGATRPAA